MNSVLKIPFAKFVV